MKKRLSLLLFITCSALLVAAPVGYGECIENYTSLFASAFSDGQKVAFLEITSDSKEFSMRFRSDLEYALINEDCIVLEREDMDAVMEELELQTSGLVDDAASVTLGNMLGADYVIMGEAKNEVSSYHVKLRMIDVATGTVAKTKSLDIRYDEDLKMAVEEAGDKVGDPTVTLGFNMGLGVNWGTAGKTMESIGFFYWNQPQYVVVPSAFLQKKVLGNVFLQTEFDVYTVNGLYLDQGETHGGPNIRMFASYASLDLPLIVGYEIFEKPLKVDVYGGVYASIPYSRLRIDKERSGKAQEQIYGIAEITNPVIPGLLAGVEAYKKLGGVSLSFGFRYIADLAPVRCYGDLTQIKGESNPEKEYDVMRRQGPQINLGIAYRMD